MTEREVEVHVDLAGRTVRAGRLFMRVVRGRESASFAYHEDWLRHPERFALDPVALPLGPGTFHTQSDEKLFPGMQDSAPDRWGRLLMARQARLGGERQTLFESDFLLQVHDLARQGALRFRDVGGGPFLAATDTPIPPLVRLRELLMASDRMQRDPADTDALRVLLVPGSSLGGARPKASVLDDDGQLLIAKLPQVDDEWPVIRWEHVTCRLAAAAGLAVQQTRLAGVEERPVLLARRFDRDGTARRPFLSALALLGTRPGEEGHSYLEIADAIRQFGARVDENLRELWRRMVFNVLVSNTDDHLRNHGFLREADGWVLSPAYDLNPVPVDVRPRIHALALNEHDPRCSLATVLEVASYFGLEARHAAGIARSVADATSRWRAVARARGIDRSGVERMASAFEHEDLNRARRLARS